VWIVPTAPPLWGTSIRVNNNVYTFRFLNVAACSHGEAALNGHDDPLPVADYPQTRAIGSSISKEAHAALGYPKADGRQWLLMADCRPLTLSHHYGHPVTSIAVVDSTMVTVHLVTRTRWRDKGLSPFENDLSTRPCSPFNAAEFLGSATSSMS
jgi:hypothetical protein